MTSQIDQNTTTTQSGPNSNHPDHIDINKDSDRAHTNPVNNNQDTPGGNLTRLTDNQVTSDPVTQSTPLGQDTLVNGRLPGYYSNPLGDSQGNSVVKDDPHSYDILDIMVEICWCLLDDSAKRTRDSDSDSQSVQTKRPGVTTTKLTQTKDPGNESPSVQTKRTGVTTAKLTQTKDPGLDVHGQTKDPGVVDAEDKHEINVSTGLHVIIAWLQHKKQRLQHRNSDLPENENDASRVLRAESNPQPLDLSMSMLTSLTKGGSLQTWTLNNSDMERPMHANLEFDNFTSMDGDTFGSLWAELYAYSRIHGYIKRLRMISESDLIEFGQSFEQACQVGVCIYFCIFLVFLFYVCV